MRLLVLSLSLIALATACMPPASGPGPAGPVPASDPSNGEATDAPPPGSTPGEQPPASGGRPPAAGGHPASSTRIDAAEIRSIIPRDAIPSIDDPQFVSAAEGDTLYAPEERVMAVDLNSDRRAYSVPLLAMREIVNDVVGGVPIAVTF